MLVAALTAILYLCGSAYLGSYYGGLGLPEREIQHDAATVLEASFIPLFHIVAFLVIVAVFTQMLSPASPPGRLAPFHPMPTMQVLPVVLTLWWGRLLMDLVNPPAAVNWGGYQRRDVLFYGLLVVVMVIMYVVHTVREKAPLHMTRWWITYWVGGMLLLMILLGLFGWATGGGWPYPTWQTLFLAGASVFTVVTAVFTWRSSSSEKSKADTAKEEPPAGTGDFRGLAALAAFLAVISLVLGAGLTGSVEAKEVRSGCTARDAIVFDPMPDGLHENATYWVVLHHGGTYYLREEGANATAPLVVVHDVPGTVARIEWLAPITEC